MSEAQTSFRRKRFRWRPFASFGLLWSFVLSALAGIALYLRPEGSLASWSSWSMLGLDKNTWEGVHTLAVFGMMFFFVLHIALNWRTLWGYVQRRAAALNGSRIEFAAATLLVVLLAAAAVGGWKPARLLMDARAAIKKGVLAVEVLPPVPDAAARSLAELCSLIPVPFEEAAGRLARAGYRIDDPSRSLEDLAAAFGVSPERLYRLAAGR